MWQSSTLNEYVLSVQLATMDPSQCYGVEHYQTTVCDASCSTLQTHMLQLAITGHSTPLAYLPF